MKVKISLLIFLFFMILSASQSFSQPAGMRFRPGRGPWTMEGHCWKASELNLSSDQIKELDLIHQAYFRETQLLRNQLFSKRLELKEFFISSDVKGEAIRAKSTEINQLQSKLEEKTIEYLLKTRNLLTQEQLKLWCPEMEFPPPRRMHHGPGPMGPMSPKRLPSQEGPKED